MCVVLGYVPPVSVGVSASRPIWLGFPQPGDLIPWMSSWSPAACLVWPGCSLFCLYNWWCFNHWYIMYSSIYIWYIYICRCIYIHSYSMYQIVYISFSLSLFFNIYTVHTNPHVNIRGQRTCTCNPSRCFPREFEEWSHWERNIRSFSWTFGRLSGCSPKKKKHYQMEIYLFKLRNDSKECSPSSVVGFWQDGIESVSSTSPASQRKRSEGKKELGEMTAKHSRH